MIREYFCSQCGREFENDEKMNDEPLSECLICKSEGKNSPPPKRLISLSNFHLLGGGWASSGYGNK